MTNSGLRFVRASIAGAALLLTAVFGTAPAAAQHACQGDAFRLCNQFIPDRAKVASCLFKNKRGLSAGVPRRDGRRQEPASRKGKAKGKRHEKQAQALTARSGIAVEWALDAARPDARGVFAAYIGAGSNRESAHARIARDHHDRFGQPLPAAALQALEPQVLRRVHARAGHDPVRRDAGVPARGVAGSACRCASRRPTTRRSSARRAW